jgi:hypothetical protein
LRPTHLEFAGLGRRRFEVLANALVGGVLLHPEQEFVLRHRRDRGQVGVLEGNLRDHRLLPSIRRAEDDLVWVARRRLGIGIAFGPASAALVDDDDGLIGQLVFDDDALNRASEVVRAAAGTSGCDELNWFARPPLGRRRSAREDGNGGGRGHQRSCS